MISADAIRSLLAAELPDATVELEDLTGGQDHWHAVVVAAAFEGRSPVARHRMVYKALAEPMKGPLHALKLDTWTPGEAATRRS
jgi:stress-induced morphogen